MKIQCLGMVALLAAIPAAAQPQQQRIEDYLTAHESQDPIVRKAADTVRQILPGLLKPEWTKARGVRLFVSDFKDMPLRFRPFRTATCQAAHSVDGTPLIVCNEAFLLESEIPVRAFEDAEDLLSREESLLKFVNSARADQTAMLRQLRTDRQLAARSDQSVQHIGLHMSMALLFFASHELGHLAEGSEFHSFTEAARPSADAEVRGAVLCACRQADEFNDFGFGLPGLEQSIKTGQDARKIEESFRKEVVDDYELKTKQFADERAADRFAIEVVVAYLASAAKPGAEQGLERQHLMMETLFTLAIYRWYSDLVGFTKETCGPMQDSRELGVCMMKDRQRYVAASKVFGEVHGFIFLRSYRAMEAIIRQRTRYYTGTSAERSIWPDRKKIESSGLDSLHEMWRSGDLQRFWLLRILMDTPVKFSYTACLTGWFLEMDLKRGRPQIFVMTFEPIERAVKRLEEIP